MTESIQEFSLQAPLDRMEEIIRGALSGLGWHIRYGNDIIAQVTASERVTDDRGAKARFDKEFVALVRWSKQPGAAVVSVKVTENKNLWTQYECQARCSQIRNEIVRIALQLTVNPEPQPTDHGSAKWATDADIKNAAYSGGIEDSLRLVLGPGDDEEYVTIPARETERHALVCGPTGSGKTTSIFIPNLVHRLNTSAIVTEATAGGEHPDLYWKTSFYRWSRGRQHIYYFNPDDLTSDRINPIDQVETMSDAINLASLIIRNTTQKTHRGDQMWEHGEQHLLTALILYALGERGHFGTVRNLLRKGPEGMGAVLKRSAFQEARDEYEAYYNNGGEGYRLGVSAGLMQRLNIWTDPKIVALTETTDIDIKSLPGQLFTFYLAVPADKQQLKPLAAVVFNYVLSLALKHDFAHPLTLFLDELSNFGYIAGFAEKLSILRHRHIGAVVGIQDFVQLKKVYGEDDATLMFSQLATRVFFRPNDLLTAKKISEMLGTKTHVDREPYDKGVHKRKFGRPLLMPAEVQSFNEAEAIVFTSKTPPIRLTRFSPDEYNMVTHFPPPPRRSLVVDDRLTPARYEQETDAEAIWGDMSPSSYKDSRMRRHADGELQHGNAKKKKHGSRRRRKNPPFAGDINTTGGA